VERRTDTKTLSEFIASVTSYVFWPLPVWLTGVAGGVAGIRWGRLERISIVRTWLTIITAVRVCIRRTGVAILHACPFVITGMSLHGSAGVTGLIGLIGFTNLIALLFCNSTTTVCVFAFVVRIVAVC